MVSVLFLIIEFQLKMSSRMEHFSSVACRARYQKHKLNQKISKGTFMSKMLWKNKEAKKKSLIDRNKQISIAKEKVYIAPLLNKQ